MTHPQHYIGKLCNCRNQNVIIHSPKRIETKGNYDPKGDFVPMEEILEDLSETKINPSCANSSHCCIHGVPCVTGSQTSLSSRSRSSSSNGSEYQNLGYASMKKPSNENISRSSSAAARYVKIHSPASIDKAYEKVRIDQNSGPNFSRNSHKTRWPLTELIAEMNYSSSWGLSSLENLNHQTFYDCYSNNSEDDTKSLGRRKTKKTKKCLNDDEKYPKLQSVLEDTGYIELKVSTSNESESKSRPPKSARRKNKKTRRNSKNPWVGLPYADVGFLENKHGDSSSSKSHSKSRSRVRTPDATTSEALSTEEFATQASDLEMLCRYYLGHKTLDEIENGKYSADSFYFYHLLPNVTDDYLNLQKCIRLYVLYITPTKRFKHYAVIKCGQEFCVECDKKHHFSSLKGLVQFYALNKSFRGKNGHKQRFPGD